MNPELSVVIVVVTDANHLKGCIQSLENQIDPPVMEILVPYAAGAIEISNLQSTFPSICFEAVSQSNNEGTHVSHQTLDDLRATGLHRSRGRIVALLEDHDRADPHWARNMIELHKNSYAAVGGAIENEIDRPLNWAVYFCDFGRYQNPVKEGPAQYISDVNTSYKRDALEKIPETWKHSFHETTVNDALRSRGETLWLSPAVIVYQHRENLRFASAVTERLLWGRFYAGIRAQEIDAARRFAYVVLSPALTFLLVGRKLRDIVNKKRNAWAFFKALPLIVILTFFWSMGELVGYWTAKPFSNANPAKKSDFASGITA